MLRTYLDLLQSTATDDGRAYELLSLERAGITMEQVAKLQHRYALTDQDVLSLLSLNRRTLQRRRSNGEPLGPADSANLLEVARVFAFASEVFGDDEKVKRWTRRPNAALGDETPLQLLSTSTGRGLVRDVIGRFAHGVFA